MTTVVTPGTWTAERVEDLVIELLADLLMEDAVTLRAALLAQGSGMPVDSLDLFDILADFRSRTGLRIPVRKLGRRTMRSVKRFSEFVAREATT